MEAERLDHRCRVETESGGEEAGERNAETHGQKREQAERLFAHDQQEENRGKGKEARDLTQCMERAHLPAAEADDLDSEIGVERVPGGKAELVGHRHEHERQNRPFPVGCAADGNGGALEHRAGIAWATGRWHALPAWVAVLSDERAGGATEAFRCLVIKSTSGGTQCLEQGSCHSSAR
jgi:hypothetical protein